MWRRLLDLTWRRPWVRSGVATLLSTIIIGEIALRLAASSGCESRGEWACLGAALIALAVAAPVTVGAWWVSLRTLRVPRAGLITLSRSTSRSSWACGGSSPPEAAAS